MAVGSSHRRWLLVVFVLLVMVLLVLELLVLVLMLVCWWSAVAVGPGDGYISSGNGGGY